MIRGEFLTKNSHTCFLGRIIVKKPSSCNSARCSCVLSRGSKSPAVGRSKHPIAAAHEAQPGTHVPDSEENFLLQRNRPRQRLEHVWTHVRLNDVAARSAAFSIVCRNVTGRQTAVLPRGEVHAELVLGVITRANLRRRGVRVFNAHADLRPAIIFHGQCHHGLRN